MKRKTLLQFDANFYGLHFKRIIKKLKERHNPAIKTRQNDLFSRCGDVGTDLKSFLYMNKLICTLNITLITIEFAQSLFNIFPQKTV